MEQKHRFAYNEYEEEFEQLKQQTCLIKANQQHRKNLQLDNKKLKQQDLHKDLKTFDTETHFKMHGNGEGFQTHLSFFPFEWYLAEEIATNKAQLDVLEEKQRLKLTMSIFPSQYSSLLHIIAAKTEKKEQSLLASEIRTLLEDEKNYFDEKFAEDENAEQF